MTYETLKLCSSKGAFEAIPSPKLHLDLSGLARKVQAAGREVVDARVMLILPGRPEVTLMRDGKLVFKTSDEAEALLAFKEIRALLDLPP